MADLEKIMTALRNAHAAGDTAAATRLAAMAKSAKADPGQAMRDRISAAKAGTLQMSPQRQAAQAEIDRPVEQTLRDPGAIGALVLGAGQGATLGFGDEITGGLAAAGGAIKDVVTGDFSGIGNRAGQRYADVRDAMREAKSNASFARPKTTLAGEVAGSFAIPVPGAGQVNTVGQAVKAGVKTGASYGFGYGFGGGEGGVVSRLESGLSGAVGGAIIGGAVPVVLNGVSRALGLMLKKSAEKPSIESLRSAKNAAYSAVDGAGERFGPSDLSVVVDRAKTGLDEVNFLPEAELVTAGMFRRMEEMAKKEVSLGQLDKFRRSLWDRYNTSKEPGLLEMVDAIDEVVSSRASTSSLLDAARLANARYKKAELLDLAFQKARDQTAATGSGGNILNKMRQAIVSVINNPKQSKWFTEAEIGAMREFSRGNISQNAMRQIGKLSPTGNGLMTALNLGAVSVNPAMLTVSAVASGAKAISDRAAEKSGQGLISLVAGQGGQQTARVIAPPQRVNALSGLAGSQF